MEVGWHAAAALSQDGPAQLAAARDIHHPGLPVVFIAHHVDRSQEERRFMRMGWRGRGGGDFHDL
jgi:hypothetical protein